MITTFALARIQRLRKQAAEAASSDTEPAKGWSISSVDPKMPTPCTARR